MTAAERLQAEKERLLAATGFYEECRFIMAIVNAAIPNAADQTEESKHDDER